MKSHSTDVDMLQKAYGSNWYKHMPMLVDTSMAADLLGVHPRTVTRMCEQGKLKAVRVMSLWRINRDALLTYVGLI